MVDGLKGAPPPASLSRSVLLGSQKNENPEPEKPKFLKPAHAKKTPPKNHHDSQIRVKPRPLGKVSSYSSCGKQHPLTATCYLDASFHNPLIHSSFLPPVQSTCTIACSLPTHRAPFSSLHLARRYPPSLHPTFSEPGLQLRHRPVPRLAVPLKPFMPPEPHELLCGCLARELFPSLGIQAS